MTEDNQQNQQKEEKQLPPSTTPVPNNEVDKNINSEGGGNDTPKEGQPRLEVPQPFIVKVEKEKRKWPKTTEVVSVFALLISITAVILNKCSLDNTSKALAITDKTFKDNHFKDSMTFISNRRKDSLDSIQRGRDYTRDTTNITLSKQSLQQQIISIEENRKEFQLESRGIAQITDVIIDTTTLKNPFKVPFTIRNVGKFPITIYYRKVGMALEYDLSVDQVKTKIDRDNGWKISRGRNDVISSITHLDNNMNAKEFTQIQYEQFMNGITSLYVFFELEYSSYGVNKKYRHNVGYKITRIPNANQLNYGSVEYADYEIQKR